MPDGRKEIIDFHLAASEGAAERQAFPRPALSPRAHRRRSPDDLRRWRPGPLGGAAGRLSRDPGAALWAHKIRNILNKVRKVDHDPVKRDLHAIMNAPNRSKAFGAARRFADAWQETYPKAVASVRHDLDELLTYFQYATLADRKQVRTTNAIERRFREVRRRIRYRLLPPGWKSSLGGQWPAGGIRGRRR